MRNGFYSIMEPACMDSNGLLDKTGPLLSFWFRPRDAARLILAHKTPWTHFRILITLTFTYFLLFVAFLWIGNISIDSSQLFWVFAFIAGAATCILNLSSLVFYYPLRAVGGLGTFPQTKTIIHWSSICGILIGICSLLFIWFGLLSAKEAEKGIQAFLFTDTLQVFSAVGMITFSIYGLVILTKMLSEIHQISAGKAFAAVLAGLFTTCVFAPMVLMVAIRSFK